VFAEPESERFVELLRETYRSGAPATDEESGGIRPEGAGGGVAPVFYDFAYVPLRDPAGAVCGVVVQAIDVTGLVSARRAGAISDRRLRALTDAGVIGVIVADGDTRILEANDTFLEMVGRRREEVDAGRLSWRSMTVPEDLQCSDARMEQMHESGRVEPFEKEYLRPDGTRVPVLVGSVRVDEDPLRMMSFVIDQSARRAAEDARERLLERERAARREAELTIGRMARLQRATAALGVAVTAAEVGERTVAHATAGLGADAGALGLLGEDEFVLLHDRGYDRATVSALRRFPITHPGPVAEAVRRGEPVVVNDVPEWRRWPELAGLPHRFAAAAAVPLIAAGRTLGAIALSFREARTLRAADRAFLLALADQAAQALDRARLYEERAYVARTLQAGLLPDRLATAPGLEIAVRYHSIADGGEVGGDFYDFFDVPGDDWIVFVGDVAGKGSAAAVLTGLARHTLRAVGIRGEPPAAMLEFLNEALRRQASPAAFCTVGCGTLHRVPDGYRARFAFGGHPYPLLVRAGGGVEEIPIRGMLLGVEPDPALEEVELVLRPGDTLLLRTDGVEDARGPNGERFGTARVAEAFGAAAGAPAEAVAEAVDAAVTAYEAGPRRDDRAIVVLRVTP
jgi:PAS domain S-box-containing protein